MWEDGASSPMQLYTCSCESAMTDLIRQQRQQIKTFFKSTMRPAEVVAQDHDILESNMDKAQRLSYVEVLEKVGKNKLQFPAEDYELTIGITASDGRGSAVSHAETWLLSLRFAPTSSTCYRLAVDSVRDPILYSAGLKFVPFR